MLKFVIPGVLAFALLVLSWMSLLRVDNMAHDMAVLRQDVDVLKQQGAAGQGGSPPAPPTTAPLVGMPLPAPSGGVPSAPPASTAQTFEATPQAFFSSSFNGPQTVTLPVPAGTTLRGAQVVIVAVEGEGVAPVMLPSPQPSVILQPGQPQPVSGLCQGGEGAAWVFTLEGASVRLESRECRYPVRGLRPRLRISVLR